jgi:GNAT superfamily N-acetyltransferase
MTVFRIEKLDRSHAVEAFECSELALTRFLTRFALSSQQSNAAATYVGLADERVIGFYSLVVGEVQYEGAPERLIKGMARHPVPLMLLARLAVDQGWQGRGIGAGLLKDAMWRTLQAADIAGIRALAVHAKGEKARAFYQHFDFIDAPSDPLHLFLLIKDLRRAVSA